MDDEQEKQDAGQEDPNPDGIDLSGLFEALGGSSAAPPPEAPPVEAPPVEAPPAATPPPVDFGGRFGSTYNLGIDAGYTPFGEGLGDEERYGDPSKDYRVGVDPTPMLENIFGGGGGVMGAGLRGAFDAIARERARTGQEAITPAKFTDMAAEGTLTRVYPELDPKTGEVYRVYQYGDKDPRYTKEKVYTPPPKPAAPTGGGTGGSGQQGGVFATTAQEKEALANFKVPAGGKLLSLKENADGFVEASLRTGDGKTYPYTWDWSRNTWVPGPASATAEGIRRNQDYDYANRTNPYGAPGPGGAVGPAPLTPQGAAQNQQYADTVSPYGQGGQSVPQQPVGFATGDRFIRIAGNVWLDTATGQEGTYPSNPNNEIIPGRGPVTPPAYQGAYKRADGSWAWGDPTTDPRSAMNANLSRQRSD